nr:SJCHGC05318 protein [Schistosoma japonicum]
MTSIDNSNCEISGEKHKASPLDDGYKWHLRTGASQCCAWGDFSLRDAIGTALVILNSISKTGFRRITNRSHRNKEWDRDTLKLHSWFSAICLLEMPASLRQVFLSVRRKLEEDYVLCAFCRNNGEPPDIYITHEVRDQDGRVTCPVLRVLSCPNCHATGDRAHTIKYCPHPRQF